MLLLISGHTSHQTHSVNKKHESLQNTTLYHMPKLKALHTQQVKVESSALVDFYDCSHLCISSFHWYSSLSVAKFCYNLFNACYCSCDEAQDTKENYEEVLPQLPVAWPHAWWIPVCDKFYDGWEHEAKSGQTDSTHQWNEWTQLWDCHSYGNCWQTLEFVVTNPLKTGSSFLTRYVSNFIHVINTITWFGGIVVSRTVTHDSKFLWVVLVYCHSTCTIWHSNIIYRKM